MYLRFNEVCELVRLKKTTIYALIKKGVFPRPIKLGRASLWVKLEITQFMDNAILSRDTFYKSKGDINVG